MQPKFFRTPQSFRKWFEAHHDKETLLWVGFYKKGSGKPSITWPESVDQALCFGWIDGVRKSIDEISYMIRFSPRKSRSVWSTVNIRRAGELIQLGQMKPAGFAAFESRLENKSGIYAYEQRSVELPEPYAGLMKANEKAWLFYQSQAASYRKVWNWWVVSAKREETRLKRLHSLINDCANHKSLKPSLTKSR